jgi:methylenetetrahydrofolate reductase (NADPH)
MTCTYGAGGSTRDKTLDIVQYIKQEFQIRVASHLTCVGSSVDQLRDYLRGAAQRDVDYIVALRGDPPQGQADFQVAHGGLRYANELVALIRREFAQFGIAVAGYPEKHLEAPSFDVDLENLKRKVDTGADIVITQLFYNNQDYFRFRDRCERIGIRVPLVPGILPVTNLAQVRRITSMCGAKLPADFIASLEQCPEVDAQIQLGVDFATEQVRSLIAGEVPGLHFYVLNKSHAASTVLESVALPVGSG